MKAHELDIQKSKSRVRAGRGISAGRGKTAGRGTKGQNARSGGKRKAGFEGGQNPLIKRLPKLRGFTSKRDSAVEIYTGELAALGATINHETLHTAGRIPSIVTRVKVVLNGKISSKVSVSLDGASAGAMKAIEAAGGSFTKKAGVRKSTAESKPDTKK